MNVHSFKNFLKFFLTATIIMLVTGNARMVKLIIEW